MGLEITINPRDYDLTVDDVLKTYNEAQKKYLYKCMGLAITKGRVFASYATESEPILNTFSIKQKMVLDYLITKALDEFNEEVKNE